MSDDSIEELIENEEQVQTRSSRYPDSESAASAQITSRMLSSEVEGKRKAKGIAKKVGNADETRSEISNLLESLLDELDKEFQSLALEPEQISAVRNLLLKSSYANGLAIAVAIIEVVDQLKKAKTISMGA